jgi:hypothetical protein
LRITGHARTDSKTGGNRTSILGGGLNRRERRKRRES